MTYSTDPIAAWHFNFKRNHTFSKENSEKNQYPIEYFWNLKKIIDIFSNSKLLYVQKIKCIRGKGNYNIAINHENSIEIIDKIVSEMKNKPSSSFLSITGKTNLIHQDDDDEYENIISLGYDFITGWLIVRTHSDCWLPIDRDDDFQIELAELNAPRLEKVLMEIKALGYDDISPDIGEDYAEELLPQKGFKIYLNSGYYESYVDFPKNKESIIRKYFWKNRNNN